MASAPGLTPSPLPASVRWAQAALGLGFLALVVFLFVLEGVFRAELDTQRAQVEAHRAALEAYATSRFQQKVDDALAAARQTALLAREDPLLPTGGAVLWLDGVLVVPARAGVAREQDDAAMTVPVVGDPVTAPGDTGGETAPPPVHLERPAPLVASEELKALRDGVLPAADDDGPWAARRRTLAALRSAAAKDDRPKVEQTVREILAQRAHYVLPPEQDLPSVIVLLDALKPPLRVSPVLARSLLRDGFREPVPVEGLERQVLRAASRLTAEDVQMLCDETQQLARAHGVRADDFAARCREVLAAPVRPLPGVTAAEWLEGSGVDGLAWRRHGGELVGAPFDEAVARSDLEREMRELGLFVAGDGLERPGADLVAPLEGLHLPVHVGRLDAALEEQRTAFALKTALVFVASLLGVAMVLTALVAQRRKHRFVELKSDFIATVSHELRTPLASLRLMAETLERKLEGTGVGKDYPQRLVREVDGLSHLVENILSFNRIDKGRMVAHRVTVPLSSFVGQLEEEAAAYPAAKVELGFEGFDTRTVLADAGLLQLLFSNLLRNACRYNVSDPVRVAFSVHGEPGHTVIRVKDNGVGVGAGEREAVFEPFRRGEKRGRGGAGSGLGLALCRRIAQLHGGGLEVVASSPEGTTFELKLSTR